MIDGSWGTRRLGLWQFLVVSMARWTPVGRPALRRYVLSNLHKSGPHDITVRGIRYRCHVGDNASENKLLHSGRRKDRRQLALTVGRLKPGDVFVDIGANFGLYTLPAARAVGPSGRVIAIEPNPVMTGRLRFNSESNGFRNIEIDEVAVGAEPGEARLSIDPRQYGLSSLAQQAGTTDRVVPVVTLADLITGSGVSRIDTLKIDVEGFEDQALLPFFDACERRLWPRTLLIETKSSNCWRKDCLAELSQRGYRIAWKGSDDALLVLD